MDSLEGISLALAGRQLRLVFFGKLDGRESGSELLDRGGNIVEKEHIFASFESKRSESGANLVAKLRHVKDYDETLRVLRRHHCVVWNAHKGVSTKVGLHIAASDSSSEKIWRGEGVRRKIIRGGVD